MAFTNTIHPITNIVWVCGQLSRNTSHIPQAGGLLSKARPGGVNNCVHCDYTSLIRSGSSGSKRWFLF